MEMLEFQPGMGFGASRFRLVFSSSKRLDAFNSLLVRFRAGRSGPTRWQTAKTKAEGGALAGAVTVSKGVKMYQLDDEGAHRRRQPNSGKVLLG